MFRATTGTGGEEEGESGSGRAFCRCLQRACVKGDVFQNRRLRGERERELPRNLFARSCDRVTTLTGPSRQPKPYRPSPHSSIFRGHLSYHSSVR
jgi:hypothetical protein